MKDFARQLLLRSRYPFAIGAGLLLAAAFPSINIAGLAWIAPALILAAAHGKTGRDAFRIGYVAGLALWLASLNWLLRIPATGYPILGWVALSAYLALYPATWVWFCSVQSPESAVQSWAARLRWGILGAAAWVALEMIQSRLFSGFPWNLLGASQYRLLPLIQIASVTGVYGVSFLVVWTSLSLFSAALAILRQPTQRHPWMAEVILPVAVLLAVFVFGMSRLREQRPDGPTLRVTMIQPSIPQKMIWASGEDSSWFQGVLDLTTRALTNETDLVIWPEAALPKRIRYDDDTLLAVTGLALSNRVWMIIGSDDTEPRPDSQNPEDQNDFNCSFLVSPDGVLVARYCKRNLVIFGEYVPLVRWLPFVKWFTPITSGFTPGDKVVPFEMSRWDGTPGGLSSGKDSDSRERPPFWKVKTAPLICFEDVFPHLVREYVDDETDFLVNLTNDGWFGEGSEQWEHAANAVFRAVENNVPLVRSCNNGLTCWIDSRGRLREIFRDQAGGIYGPGVLTIQIPILGSGENRPRTFYNRHGDWFGWLCVAWTALALLGRRSKFSRHK